MKHGVTLIAALACSAGLAACNPNQGGGNGQTAAAPADTKADEKAIKDVEAASLADWKAKKADGVASHYASDATTYVSGQAPSVGHDKILSDTTTFVKDPNFSLDYTNKETVVATSGDLGYTKGTYHVTYTDPKTKQKVNEDGNYVTVFRKQPDGSWKMVEDAAVSGPAKAGA
ncbi:MAG TPA: SgcJ/EcaC family oxidoreductase [Allosphingosinicella sp.]|jgi:uncharacterized protein (TIGR02246 family)|nr:SgcJ/EcaC family oxidoreductase [Allosphingosinicella sp.]